MLKKNHNNVRVKNWENNLYVEKLSINVFVLILIHEDVCDKNAENIIISGKSPFSVSPLKVKKLGKLCRMPLIVTYLRKHSILRLRFMESVICRLFYKGR